MKKITFSNVILFAICIGIFSLLAAGCKPKPEPGPSALASFHKTGDKLLTAVANLEGYVDADGKVYTAEDYAVWIDMVGLYKSGGYKTNFSANYWPVAMIYPEMSMYEPGHNYAFNYLEDQAGYYIVLKAGRNTVAQKVKKGSSIEWIEIPAYGEYVCNEGNVSPEQFQKFADCLCIDPSTL